ncbi:Microtubule-binding calmodulin-regulated spectrin-associated [Phytophthora infestans]|nr:Microtubule-binding calmodulin-regulated spectrin-associated [Phytophthora infestans]KAF4130436.1 Microtubule-binding calmodulin-regulated spectrin-associated [Phytophthora infestans]
MSRKKILSPTASLASCLDFAARILSSTASVRDICTKSALAPMVVEAHRCGQQVGKSLKLGACVDVRKLLNTLQCEENNKLCRQSPIAELEVADLTWDFEGTVVDTLTMEIEELEDRAALSDKDTCVVLSASSQAAGGHAVIWFPLDSVNDRKKRQILLYVCPGRVKIVKNVSDLIKKLYDEVPILREGEATYKVWAVIMGFRSHNQLEDERASTQLEIIQGEKYQEMPDSILKPTASIALSVNDTNQIRPMSRSTESTRLRNSSNQEMIGNPSASDVLGTQDESRDDPEQGIILGVPPRLSGYRDITNTKPSLTKSIFFFDGSHRSCTELLPRSSERVMDNSDTTEGFPQDKVAVNSNADSSEPEATSSGDEMDLHATGADGIGDLHESKNSRPRRSVISSSLSKLTIISKEKDTETDFELGLGVPLQHGFAWQSCDGKVLRNTIMGKPTREEPKKSEHLTSRCDSEDKKEATVEEQREIDAVQDDAHDNCIAEVEQSVNMALRSHEEQTPPLDIDENPPVQTLIMVTTTEDDTLNRPSTNQDGDNPRASGLSGSVGRVAVSSVDKVGNVDGDDFKNSSSIAVGTPSVPDSHDEEVLTMSSELPKQFELVSSVQKQKRTVNYRNKLGARIWWELEYTAKRLEREEMMERQQRAHQHQRDIKQRKPVVSRHSRRVEPTELSTNHRLVTPRDEGNSSINHDRSDSDKHNTEADHGDEEYVLASGSEILEAEAKSLRSDQSPRSFVNEVPPCKLASSPKSQHGLAHSEPTKEFERVGSCFLASKGENVGMISASDAPDLQEEESGASATPAISPDVSLSNRSMSSQQGERKPSDIFLSKPLDCKFMKSSFARVTVKPTSTKSSNQAEDEDDALTQMMWGSTRTSYEQDRNTDIFPTSKEQQTSEVAAVPFTARGRVPMRTRIIPATDERSSSSSIEHSSLSDHDRSDTKLSTHSRPPRHKVSSTPAPVATFIALGEEKSLSTSTKSREERLKELRQKKLQKLQQTRNSSLQQKEKLQRRPLSFSNSNYTKKASNRQLIQNALEFTLLAGGSMEKERSLALQALAESTCDNFIVLLKSAKELKFRALYESHVDRDFATRIFSLLPSNSSRAPLKLGSSDMISQFFKYSSAKKHFQSVPTRSFTVKTDACALTDQVVFKGKTGSALARLL